jgi:hypothetical protein
VAFLKRTLAQPAAPPWRPRWVRQVAFAGRVLAWFCKRSFGLCRWTMRHPTGAATVLGVIGLWFVMEALRTGARKGILILLIVACLWWVTWMQSLDEGNRPLVAWWRKVSLYRKWWQPIMLNAGLNHGNLVPELRRVRVDGVFDVVEVRMLDGQPAIRWYEKREYLAEAFEARTCTVYAVGGTDRTVILEFAVRPGPSAPADGQW